MYKFLLIFIVGFMASCNKGFNPTKLCDNADLPSEFCKPDNIGSMQAGILESICEYDTNCKSSIVFREVIKTSIDSHQNVFFTYPMNHRKFSFHYIGFLKQNKLVFEYKMRIIHFNPYRPFKEIKDDWIKCSYKISPYRRVVRIPGVKNNLREIMSKDEKYYSPDGSFLYPLDAVIFFYYDKNNKGNCSMIERRLLRKKTFGNMFNRIGKWKHVK